MKALFINCTLKRSPETSNTEALATVVAGSRQAACVRDPGDRNPDLARPALEPRPAGARADGRDDRRDRRGRAASRLRARRRGGRDRQRGRRSPRHIGGGGSARDIGYTIPGQAWTYWDRGPGPGKQYLEEEAGHEWSVGTGRTAAANLLATARALRANLLPAP